MKKLSQEVRRFLAKKEFKEAYQEVEKFFKENKEYAKSNLEFRQLNDKFLVFTLKNSISPKNPIPLSEGHQQWIDSLILIIQEIETLQNDLKSNFKLNIGEVIKILPLVTGLLIYLGFYNKAYYFKGFDIVIYNFVNTSEIILSFLPIISYILIFVLIQITIYFIFYISNFIRRRFNQNKVIGKIVGTKKLVEHFDDFINKNEPKHYTVLNIIIHPRFVLLIILIFISFYLGDNFIYAENKRSKIYIYIIFVISIWYSFIIEFIYFIIYRILELKRVRKVRVILITCALWLMLIIISGNILQAKKIKNGNEIFVSFKYMDSLITTCDSLYFIGETKDYIFLYEFNKDTLLRDPSLRDSLLSDILTRDTILRSNFLTDILTRDTSLKGNFLRDNFLRDILLKDSLLKANLQKVNFLRDPVFRDTSLRNTFLRDNLLRDILSRDTSIRNTFLRNKVLRDTTIWNAQVYERKNITHLKYKQIDKNGLRFPGN